MNRLILGCCIVAAHASCGISAADDAVDKSVPGIEVGAHAPDFELKDQNGESKQLSDFVKPGQSVAIVFYRSADW